MRVSARTMLAALFPVAAVLVVLAQSPARGPQVVVALELSQQFYYEGDPLNVRISVRNMGGQKLANPIKSPLFENFKVRSTDRGTLEPAGSAGREEPVRPEKLSSGSFYGGVVNLAEIYGALKQVGTYEIYWAADGIISETLVVTVIPRYDPAKEYTAQIETDQGPIVINLFGNESPIAVKSFVDLANAGFYRGLQFNEVHADSYVVGGDPRFVDPPRPAITYPAEPSSIPLVAGSVLMKPIRPAPPTNGPTFIIVLRPQPAWTGQVTVLGQVAEGLDVVRKISRSPSTETDSRPQFKPLKEVKIRGITIREKPARPAVS